MEENSITDAPLPTVSVVVTTYQHVAFIEHCIQGILMQQTSFPVEILIGEDGSTDGTREICQRLAMENRDKIRLVLQSRENVIYMNGNPTGRYNILSLLAKTRGQYIAMCEGDDLWTDPDKLSKQIAVLERKGNEQCMGSFHATRMIGPDGKPTGKLMHEHLPERVTVRDTIASLAPFHTSSFVFRASPLLRSFPSWCKKVTSFDMALFCLFIKDGYYEKVEGIMSSYRKHEGGITMSSHNLGTLYHYHRIRLWVFMDRHLGYRYTKRCEALFKEHWKGIVQQTTPRVRIGYLGRLVREVPSWFLRKPHFFLQRVLETLKR